MMSLYVVLFLAGFLLDALASGDASPDALHINVSAEEYHNESYTLEENEYFDEEMLYFGLDLGTPQTLAADFETQSVAKIIEARAYMETEGSNTNPSCRNLDESCTYWAVIGECERARKFMTSNCAPMCKLCHESGNDRMDSPNPNTCAHTENALQPGDLNKLFERIASDPNFAPLEPRVVSRPTLASGDTMETAEYVVGGPWVIIFDKAVSDQEADRLIELASNKGYARSLNGSTGLNGESTQNVDDKRTSQTVWCDQDCLDDDLVFGIVNRIESITAIPHGYSEHLQLLRYTEGQFYKLHHDYIPQEVFIPNGPRILTFYIYLSDVEQGGGTNFPYVDPSNPGLTVMPKKGRAVLWPSVLDDTPDVQDERTMHQALPVIKGVKYGANAWVHLRNFKANLEQGCTLR